MDRHMWGERDGEREKHQEENWTIGHRERRRRAGGRARQKDGGGVWT